MTIRTRAAALSLLVVGVLALAGCATESAPPGGGAASDQPAASTTPTESDTVVEEDDVVIAAVQAEDCGWADPKIAPAVDVPTGTDGPLDVVLVGAWQHTHFDTGAGYEPVGEGTDVRYVFPSTERILYCQDVEGATDQAQNAAAFTLEGTEIVLPAPANGYGVVAWDSDSMVWANHRDGSHYLLQRR